jgi:hypothetical protein
MEFEPLGKPYGIKQKVLLGTLWELDENPMGT